MKINEKKSSYKKKLSQEYRSVHILECALDFKFLNDCKIYKKKECMRICKIPKVLINNSYTWR